MVNTIGFRQFRLAASFLAHLITWLSDALSYDAPLLRSEHSTRTMFLNYQSASVSQKLHELE